MSGAKGFTVTTKGNESGRNDVIEDSPGSYPDYLYAVVDDPSNGDVLCTGRLDDVRAYIRENGYGCLFQRVRVFTLH